jgi:hypothetical protein
MKRTELRRTGMPPRAGPMRLCGPQYWTPEELPEGARLKDGDCPCGALHAWPPPAAASPLLAARRPATGFPLRVKLLVRARAGFGDIEDAMCEACGVRLGREWGQVHHVCDRGMGGCTLPVVNGPANAALLCGTPLTGCHGLVTAFDPELGRRGYWLSQAADPRLHKMILHGGIEAWRTEDGRYLYASPAGGAA